MRGSGRRIKPRLLLGGRVGGGHLVRVVLALCGSQRGLGKGR